ncbi:four helix bundle protein [Candidatus Dojkabacteria bacterium]|uniref:Four helix bundle protein n=1 Tax=Candidatus Dojkabacteria bacterium TaxID=2099670 RepID=A0A955LAC1_9BACT|nr:four helix bundle protein [Candidatus Dojkabacteria bacterium]
MASIFELEVYTIAEELSDAGWKIYENLPKVQQYHIGNQVLRSLDSIGANIAEGFGRFHYLDSLRFYYNARGSLWESKFWLTTLQKRNLITNDLYKKVANDLEIEGIKLNNFINSIKRNSKNNNK